MAVGCGRVGGVRKPLRVPGQIPCCLRRSRTEAHLLCRPVSRVCLWALLFPGNCLCGVTSTGQRATNANSVGSLGQAGGWGLGGCPHAAVRSPPPKPRSRFLYSDEVQIGPETVMTTLYTAKKYAVPALEAHCVEFLKKNLRADNAFMLLTQVRDGGVCVQVCRCGARPQGAGRGRGTRWGAGAPGLRKDAGAWVRVRTPGQGRTDGGISEFRRRLTLAPG